MEDLLAAAAQQAETELDFFNKVDYLFARHKGYDKSDFDIDQIWSEAKFGQALTPEA